MSEKYVPLQLSNGFPSYPAAEALLYTASHKSIRRRKVDHHTYLDRLGVGEAIGLRLHRTNVLIWRPDHSLEINSGGWRTLTTSNRINNWLPLPTEVWPGIRLYSVRGEWCIAVGYSYPYNIEYWDEEWDQAARCWVKGVQDSRNPTDGGGWALSSGHQPFYDGFSINLNTLLEMEQPKLEHEIPFQIGDIVQIGETVKPKYLANAIGTVIELCPNGRQPRVRISLDRFAKRWPKNGRFWPEKETRCPTSLLTKISTVSEEVAKIKARYS